jgi:hypothetical protein
MRMIKKREGIAPFFAAHLVLFVQNDYLRQGLLYALKEYS